MDDSISLLPAALLLFLISFVAGIIVGDESKSQGVAKRCESIGYLLIDDTVYECTKRESSNDKR